MGTAWDVEVESAGLVRARAAHVSHVGLVEGDCNPAAVKCRAGDESTAHGARCTVYRARLIYKGSVLPRTIPACVYVLKVVKAKTPAHLLLNAKAVLGLQSTVATLGLLFTVTVLVHHG